jgi:mannosidase alpha-like ER degradation enhancer 2
MLAEDLGNRLLPAFTTPTEIPFGTVNLRSGVPKGETSVSSTAGAGSLLVEFEVFAIF